MALTFAPRIYTPTHPGTQIGTLNGLFVLGRSIGFIGHYLDQKRLKQGLYRHPWDDISYMSPEVEERTLAEGPVVVAKGTGNPFPSSSSS